MKKLFEEPEITIMSYATEKLLNVNGDPDIGEDIISWFDDDMEWDEWE